MKILLLGDYSNFHPSLAAALARKGHSVTVASDGSRWMQTARAVDLRRRLPGQAGGALLFARMMTADTLTGYDVVSLISPTFVTLRPQRLRRVVERLRRRNGSVYLGAVGTDKMYMDMVTASDCPLPYTEYTNPDGSPNLRNAATLAADRLWQQGKLGDYCEWLYDTVDGVSTALYEYHLAALRRFPADKVVYTGIPIDLDAVKPLGRILAEDDRVKLFLGRDRRRMAFKGTDILGDVARAVADDNPDRCTLEIVENLPYNQYMEAQRRADVVIDQLYSMTPATNALLAMTRGQVAVSGAESAYYDFIGEGTMRPLVNAVPDENELYSIMLDLVLQPDMVRALGHTGREFVAAHNAADRVADRHLALWGLT